MLYKAINMFYNNDFDSALYYFQKSLTHSIFSNLKIYEWQSHNNLAIYYLTKNQTELAIKHFEKAAVITSKLVTFNKISKNKIHDAHSKLSELNFTHEVLSKHLSWDGKFHESVLPLISGQFIYLSHNIKILLSCLKEDLNSNILKRYNLPRLNIHSFLLLQHQTHPLLRSWRGKQFIMTID